MHMHLLTTDIERGDEGALIGPTVIDCANCGKQWRLSLTEREQMFDALLTLTQEVAPALLGRLLEASEGERDKIVLTYLNAYSAAW